MDECPLACPHNREEVRDLKNVWSAGASVATMHKHARRQHEQRLRNKNCWNKWLTSNNPRAKRVVANVAAKIIALPSCQADGAKSEVERQTRIRTAPLEEKLVPACDGVRRSG